MNLYISSIVQPLVDLVEAIMVFFHDQVGFGWGASIIALTVVVRAALIPLTVKQFRSMQALQQYAPQIKEMQARYKDDRQKLNQEMMKFYQENKINPLSSCLPLLAQLPIFFALFEMLRKDLRQDICNQTAKACGDIIPGSAEFLFIPDLTDAATGWVLALLIGLYIASQLASSILMATANQDKMQRRIMIALPLVFSFFIIRFPAGLLVYWITTNLWTVGQQAVMRKLSGTPATAVATASGGTSDDVIEHKAPPPPPKRKKAKR